MTTEQLGIEASGESLEKELKTIFENKFDLSDPISFHDKASDFARMLISDYGREEMKRYKLFHMIIGSTTTPDVSPEFDLPNKTIERFIREEL